MGGFGRDKSKDNQGFRGLIPDNTTVHVVLIDAQKTFFSKMKKPGEGQGRTAKIFKPVFEVIRGPYAGGRIYGDIWCNVETDAVSGDPVVFGSHMTFCDLCDATNVHDESKDGEGYPMADTPADAVSIMNRMIGKAMTITVGTKQWEHKGKSGENNTIKSITPMNKEQLTAIAEDLAPIMDKVAKQKAKAAAKKGGSGLEGFDEVPAPAQDDPFADTPF